jgi:lauroyl/myristoyl acyltransferase
VREMIEKAIAKFKENIKTNVLKYSLSVPLNSWRFSLVLFLFTFWTAYLTRSGIANILKYKKALNNSQGNVGFLFNCFWNKSYDRLFPHLLAEDPARYMRYVRVEGEEHIKRLKARNTGVILISGHFGPAFRSLVFKEAFGMDVSSFSNVSVRKKVSSSSAKLYRRNSSFPYYAVGEEKQFQEALIRGEWINFLNDIPLKKRDSQNFTLFGKEIYMSELPFKTSIQYNIPILFVSVTRKEHRFYVSILPIDKFSTQKEGLRKYILLLEKMLSTDPYSGIFIAEHHF